MRKHNFHPNRLGSGRQAFLTLSNNDLEVEFEKQAQKVINETDLWHQYLKQSEKMENIRAQTQRMKQSAVHDAKNQTVVLDTSSHNDGPTDFDKTFWAKITTKSNDNSTPSTPVKRMHVGHLPDPFNNGSTFVCRMSYPKANSAPGSMTFATESDKDTWMRNTGQLTIVSIVPSQIDLKLTPLSRNSSITSALKCLTNQAA